jgi:acyl dehydratase
MRLNYGLERVRFINPVKVNSRVRFHTKIVSVAVKSPGHVLIKAEKTLEIDGEEKPAMIAETLGMLVTTAAE